MIKRSLLALALISAVPAHAITVPGFAALKRMVLCQRAPGVATANFLKKMGTAVLPVSDAIINAGINGVQTVGSAYASFKNGPLDSFVRRLQAHGDVAIAGFAAFVATGVGIVAYAVYQEKKRRDILAYVAYKEEKQRNDAWLQYCHHRDC